ncbi:MAG: hypothetical protein DLM71_10245 [Chloroflexi bacterium]|nr:MAG: hypothetical protein DLM71_10245 [Chloroflexota bacterium]
MLAWLGAWDRLRELLPRLRGYSAAVALAGPAADRAAARLAQADGDLGEATRLMDAALAGFARLEAIFDVARTAEALADLDRSRAAALRYEALAIYERLGAAPHRDRIRAAVGDA